MGTPRHGGVQSVIVAVVSDRDPIAVSVGATGDDPVAILGESAEGEVRVNAAARVEEVRVHDLARGLAASDACHREGFQ